MALLVSSKSVRLVIYLSITLFFFMSTGVDMASKPVKSFQRKLSEERIQKVCIISLPYRTSYSRRGTTPRDFFYNVHCTTAKFSHNYLHRSGFYPVSDKRSFQPRCHGNVSMKNIMRVYSVSAGTVQVIVNVLIISSILFK